MKTHQHTPNSRSNYLIVTSDLDEQYWRAMVLETDRIEQICDTFLGAAETIDLDLSFLAYAI